LNLQKILSSIFKGFKVESSNDLKLNFQRIKVGSLKDFKFNLQRLEVESSNNLS